MKIWSHGIGAGVLERELRAVEREVGFRVLAAERDLRQAREVLFTGQRLHLQAGLARRRCLCLRGRLGLSGRGRLGQRNHGGSDDGHQGGRGKNEANTVQHA